MALTEALRLVIDADTRGAVKGLEKVGATADKELKKGTTGADKLGKSMTKVGVGMVTTGAVLVGGLVKAAQASEEARLSMLKLENSVANNAELAGHTADEFADLAEAIQDKTAADADQIIEGQAVLAQFGMTADQIKELTPLIVDLSRKTGMDYAAAARLAAKASEGNAGALRRAGIAVDEAAFKADGYTATVDALSTAVGGFAEEEGKTFAGSLERMKNQLGDVVEGVGTGAVDAFSSMLGVMDPVIDKFNELDPAAQSAIGRVAAFGAAGLIFAGGASTVIGKTIQMRDNFEKVGISLRNSQGGLSGWTKGAGIAAAGVGFFAAAMFKAEQRSQALEAAARELREEAEATGKTLEQVAVDKMVRTFAESDRVSGAIEGLGLSFEQLRGPLTGSQDAFDSWAQSLRASVAGRDDAVRSADTLINRVAVLRNELGEAAQVTSRTDEATEALGISEEDAAASTDELTTEIVEQKDALNELLTATLAQFDANLRYRQSIDDVEGSLHDLRVAQVEHGLDSEEYRDQLMETEGAILAQADAAVKLYEDTAAANGETLTGKQKTEIYKNELIKLAEQLAPGSELRKNIEAYIATLGAIPGRVTTKITASTEINEGGFHTGPGRAYQATGGPVYAQRGMLMRPRGSDTVPAMLTPGEFVMSKSATNRIGVDTLAAMNAGRTPSGGDTIIINGNVDRDVIGEAMHQLKVTRLKASA